MKPGTWGAWEKLEAKLIWHHGSNYDLDPERNRKSADDIKAWRNLGRKRAGGRDDIGAIGRHGSLGGSPAENQQG